MAKLNFGTIVTGMSGKVGGQVFSRNHSGAYLRNNGGFGKSQSIAQKQSLAQQTFLSQQWKSLSSANRTGWVNLASTIKKKDTFGNDVTPTGFQVFTEWNRYRLLIGEEVNEVAGSLHAFSPPVGWATGITETSFDLKADEVDKGCRYIVYASACVSAGRSNTYTPTYIIAVLSAAEIEFGVSIEAQYMARLRPKSIGNGILKPVRAVNIATGQSFENYQIDFTIVTPDP